MAIFVVVQIFQGEVRSNTDAGEYSLAAKLGRAHGSPEVDYTLEGRVIEQHELPFRSMAMAALVYQRLLKLLRVSSTKGETDLETPNLGGRRPGDQTKSARHAAAPERRDPEILPHVQQQPL